MRFLGVIVGSCLLGTVYAGEGDKGFTYVDLQTMANQSFDANFGSGRAGNNLSAFPRGEQTFDGVKFKVGERFIQLGSPRLADQKPGAVNGIPVGKAFARLHILHSTLYGEGMVIVPDGTEIARYKLNYEDGGSESVPVVYGEDVRDWWSTKGSPRVTRGKVVWKGDSESSERSGYRIRVFAGTWENPHPAKKVVSIDYEKLFEDGVASPAAPFCLAMTLEGP